MAYLTKNNAKTTLLGSISSSVLSLTIPIADVGKFPTTGTFIATIWPANGLPVNGEIIEVTAVTSNTWTIVRAFEPIAGASVAQSWANGSIIEMLVTAGVMAQFTSANSLAGYVPVTTSTPNEIPVLDSDGLMPATTVGPESISDSAITLGYEEILSNFDSTTTPDDVIVPGLSLTITIPSGGRRLKLTTYCSSLSSSATPGTFIQIKIKEGSTILQTGTYRASTSNYPVAMTVIASFVPTSGSHTYDVAIAQSAAGTMEFGAGATAHGFHLAELG